MQVKMPWGFNDIDKLMESVNHVGDFPAVADEERAKAVVWPGEGLIQLYNNWNNTPGQHWTCYRPKGRSLKRHLEDLLEPTTDSAYLEAMERGPRRYCPHLRLVQKPMELKEWLVNGDVHNGAHFPLCVWTKNASARSAEKVKERKEKGLERRGGKGKGKGKGKGTGKTAVADN